MTVYHYCNTNVFAEIISNKTIRMSDITKSNDSMEILWITKFIKKIFDEEFEKETKKIQYFKDGYSKDIFLELVEHYSNEFFKDDIRTYSYFVCCFSENGDLLSQWRGYADDANGISIGFDSDILSSIGKPGKDEPISNDIFQYGQVCYVERNQKAQIRKIAQDLILKLKEIARTDSESIKQKSMAAFNSCFRNLFQLSIFMKNPFFTEEKEWRLCHWTSMDSTNETSKIHIENNLAFSDIGFYSQRNNIVPFIDLKFDAIKNKLIKEVVIGPKCKAQPNDIKAFLNQNKIYCEVKKSEGTYR